MKKPLLIDLVGTDTNQIPDRIKNTVVLHNSTSQKLQMLKTFITSNRDKKMLIFTETKDDAKQFSSFNYAQFNPLHGDLQQSARTNILNKFRSPDSKTILVATDVAARGLDINDIDIIIQYSVRHVDAFVHRSGRTGRAGKSGENLIFSTRDNLSFIKSLEDSLKIKITYTNSLNS